MTLCGQTKLHCPHWMQRSSPQTGTSVGDVALLVGAGARRKRAVGRNQTDGNVVAATREHRRRHAGARNRAPSSARPAGGRGELVTARRHLDLEQALQRAVHRGEVLRDHGLALAAVGLPNRLP